MFQYLAAYRVNPTLANAKRLRAYVEKHPMSVCIATADDMALLETARRHAERNPAEAAQAYIDSIRNDGKRRYALQWWGFKTGVVSEPDFAAYGIGYMAAQA